MMLNMLIGILCEVVTAASDGEKAKATEAQVRESIGNLFKRMDEDGNNQISRKEFMEMREDKDVTDALQELDVEARHFDMYAELMFQPGDHGELPTLDLEHTINLIMRLRPGSKVSALDFASFQQDVFNGHSIIKRQIHRIDKMMTKCIPYDPDVDDKNCNPDYDEDDEDNGINLSDLDKFSMEEIRA